MKPQNVLLVFPRFGRNSFWHLGSVCDVWGARAPAPPLGLMTLAAMLPPEWSVRLIDRNVEELRDEDLDWADLVMVGGMLPQRLDTLHVISRARSRDRRVVVGGPDAMSSPEVYGTADFLVLGEAEVALGAFLRAWEKGAERGIYASEKHTVDISKIPVPRFDLINFRNYLYIGVQFSRGCPFTCEFCDIIELYGRVPRSKSASQMLEELQALYDAGYRGHVDFVDDNLIGNKRNLKKFLPLLADWQATNGYPFMFSTEASLNLADDAELLEMMKACNFFAIFTGIESPDTETLIQTQKKQNTRRELADSVRKIYQAGMFVIGGFIIGFDAEQAGIAERMVACIEATSIPVCMVGLLTALPKTQLSRRLQREGHLMPLPMPDEASTAGDQCTAGLYFITLRPRQQILADYHSVLSVIYRPEAYFERVRALGRQLRRPVHAVRFEPRVLGYVLCALGRLCWQMTFVRTSLRREFWLTVRDTLRHNPRALEFVLILAAFYLHLGPFAQYVIGELEKQMKATAASCVDGLAGDSQFLNEKVAAR